MNAFVTNMLKYICSSPISLLDFLRLTIAKAKEMLKRTTALGVSRLVGASWVRRPGRTFCPQLVPPSSHLASWHLSIKTAAGKIRYCKRLLSHTGQEKACTRIIWLFVGHHAKNGPIYRKMVVIVPLLVTSKTT